MNYLIMFLWNRNHPVFWFSSIPFFCLPLKADAPSATPPPPQQIRRSPSPSHQLFHSDPPRLHERQQRSESAGPEKKKNKRKNPQIVIWNQRRSDLFLLSFLAVLFGQVQTLSSSRDARWKCPSIHFLLNAAFC